MAVTLLEFRDRFPEFAQHGDPQIQAVLNQADRETGESEWGDLHDDATYWLAAHLTAIRTREVGMFTGATPARQYSGLSQQSHQATPYHLLPYTSTLYGMEYIRLEQGRVADTIGFVV